jgi:predicted transcriptional regulator of viral defense system
MPRDSVVEQLYELAEGQDGYFATAQATKLGIDHKAINKAAYRGRIDRVSQGVYRFRRFPVLSERTHLWEAVLWPQARENVEAVLSHETALVLHGITDANPTRVHITVPMTFRLRRKAPIGLSVHRAKLLPDDYDHIDGLPVTSLDRTLLDITATSPNLLSDAVAEIKRRNLLRDYSGK